MRVLVLYNPVSGRGKACHLAVAIAQQFLQSPCDVELIQTQAGDPQKWLTPKLAFKPDAVIAVGGDGTLRQVASVLAGSTVPVYHAGSGTENLFAKSMNTNRATPESVANAVFGGERIEIDTATANGKFMLLMASVGFDAEVVTDLAETRGNSITHFSYIMPFVRQLLKWKTPEITIAVDGKVILQNKKGWAVVANSKQYARGLNPARNANITDGKLDVVFLPLAGRLSLLKWIRLMHRGTHLHHQDVIYASGCEIEVSTTSPAPWQLDGDSIGEATKMKLVCVPKSLHVLS
ncbi:MAG: NAD(+)/NADH kinase [Planctomycetes bacterium]|nr:NAD(+)/NADH kinase [Planctomycetota bacterium]